MSISLWILRNLFCALSIIKEIFHFEECKYIRDDFFLHKSNMLGNNKYNIKFKSNVMPMTPECTLFAYMSPELNIAYITNKYAISFSFNMDIMSEDGVVEIIQDFAKVIPCIPKCLEGHPKDTNIQFTFDESISDITNEVLNALKKVFNINVPTYKDGGFKFTKQ